MSIESPAAPSPRRARFPLFSFDSETGRRRPTWIVFLAGLLSVLLGIGGVAFAASAASAHNKDYEASCFGLTLSLTYYNNNGGNNTLSVKIDDVERVPQGPGSTGANFGTDYANTWTWDPSVGHSYEIHAAGWDGYALDVPRTTVAACAKPAVTLVADQCNTTGGTIDLAATATGFASYKSVKGGFPSYAESYTGVLAQDGVPVETVPNVEKTSGSFSWTGRQAGHTYTWTVTGTTNGGLTASTSTVVIGCPEAKDFSVAVNQCNVPGGKASVTVDATVVPGRSYTFVATNGTTQYGSYTVPASNTQASLSFPIALTENLTNVYIVMTDDLAPAGDPAKTKQSNVFDTKPCPTIPDKPNLTADVCNVVGHDLTVHVSFSGLVPGRDYEVLLNGVSQLTFTASSSIYPDAAGTKHDFVVTAGSYVVTIVDVNAAGVSKDSDPVTVDDCPTQPEVALVIEQCSVPGGTGTITASFDKLAAGRDYTLTIADGGNTVPGYPAETIQKGATPRVYSGLLPTHSYTVTVVDVAAPGVVAASSTTLTPCPDTPTVSFQMKCDIINGTSAIGTVLGKLLAGETYTVSIVDDKGDPAAASVDVTTASPTAPTFIVPNGKTYTVTVQSVTNAAITASASIYAAVCDIPTFPLPPELPTLALTGANTAAPMLGALGLVQFGVVLLALAAMLQFGPKRRRA